MTPDRRPKLTRCCRRAETAALAPAELVGVAQPGRARVREELLFGGAASASSPCRERTLRGSISAEATRRNDCLEFSEVEIADREQRLGGGAVLEALWQGFQPGGVVTLQRGQLGDSVAPTLGATAVIKGSPYPDCRCPGGPSSATARWRSASVIGRSPIDLRGMATPKRDVTKARLQTMIKRGS